jgi:hypothetical protein
MRGAIGDLSFITRRKRVRGAMPFLSIEQGGLGIAFRWEVATEIPLKLPTLDSYFFLTYFPLFISYFLLLYYAFLIAIIGTGRRRIWTASGGR